MDQFERLDGWKVHDELPQQFIPIKKTVPGIYTILAIKAHDGFENIPESLQEVIEESRQEIKKQNLTGESPESKELIIKSFSRHGYEVKKKSE